MRIKVTGYLDTSDMETQHVDSFHKTGLSEQGFLYYTTELALDDVQFEAESDATDEPPKRGPKK
jgi:hypothetical protein